MDGRQQELQRWVYECWCEHCGSVQPHRLGVCQTCGPARHVEQAVARLIHRSFSTPVPGH